MARIVPATAEWIAEAGRVLMDGGLVAMPTETVYGLAADASNSEAVAKIFAAKGRPARNPLIVHIPTAWEANAGADLSVAGDVYYALAEAFWPGPLTLVLPRLAAGGEIADNVTAGGGSVAFRMPAHAVALTLLRASTNLAAPSANRSEAVSPTRPEHVAESLGDAVDLILDGGHCRVGLESTVLSLVEPAAPRILRPGAITPAQIAQVIGIEPAHAAVRADAVSASITPLASPGQMRRHYAPTKPLILSDNPVADLRRHEPAALIARRGAFDELDFAACAPVGRLLPDDADGYGSELYNALHELDREPDIRAIVVQNLPDTATWLAVRDRLSRAAQPRS